MKLPEKNELIVLGYCAIVLISLGIVGVLFTQTSALGIFSLLFAIFFYLILPGYFVMLNFDFDALERVILGMIVSSALIPAILYAINIAGFRINSILIILSILLVVSPSIIYRKESKT